MRNQNKANDQRPYHAFSGNLIREVKAISVAQKLKVGLDVQKSEQRLLNVWHSCYEIQVLHII